MDKSLREVKGLFEREVERMARQQVSDSGAYAEGCRLARERGLTGTDIVMIGLAYADARSSVKAKR